LLFGSLTNVPARAHTPAKFKCKIVKTTYVGDGLWEHKFKFTNKTASLKHMTSSWSEYGDGTGNFVHVDAWVAEHSSKTKKDTVPFGELYLDHCHKAK
jgi:hypothetical protein